MKKFLSVLLVAVLALSCCSVAFAAEPGYVSVPDKVAEAGKTVDLTVTVTGEFANYEIIFTTADELTITGFTGITGNPANGKVAFAKDENVSSHSFTITIAVAADAAPGKYPVNANVLFVSDRNLVDLDVADTVGYIIIEGEPEETTEPEAPTTEPTEPEAPTTEPTEPEAPTTEPTEPEAPTTEPTVPSVPTEPTVPSVPTEPTVPSVPTEPTEPSVPTVPTEPSVPETTDPEETTPPPTTPSVPGDEPPVGKYDFAVMNGVLMSVMVLSAAAYVVLKRNAVK